MLGELNIQAGDASAVVRAESDVDSVVDVEPLGMVVHLLCDQSDASHEGKGRHEVGELETLGDRIPALDHLPAAGEDGSEHGVPLGCGEELG